MQKKKVELDVDSIGNQQQTITKEEEKVLSDYFRNHWLKRRKVKKGEHRTV